MWNFGSLLGLCLVSQILTGVFLAMHYSPDISLAFDNVAYLTRDINYGWLIRIIHANGARAFFIALYLHVGRGIYYRRFYFHATWGVGTVILLMVMATAFLGYVLPWGQISFWGASVITNLFSALPYVGGEFVTWLWGGFAVDNATLTRFFTLHFLVPFIIVAIVLLHLIFLHRTGSSNPLGIVLRFNKIEFHSFFSWKDGFGALLYFLGLIRIRFLMPWILGDPENFIPANPLVTPVHIQPEWYFLFAYAILRSIPNKLGGVLALAGAVLILLVIPYYNNTNFKGVVFYPFIKFYFWVLVGSVLLLTWIGACPVEAPYILIGQLLTVIYFIYYIFNLILFYFQDWRLK